MKILHLNFRQVECGQDPVYDGLCRILGPENVLEYPRKPSLHGGPGFSYRWPCLCGQPEFKTDEEKMEMLKNNDFDMILVGCNLYWDWRYGGRRQERVEKGEITFAEMYNLVLEKTKTISTYCLDTGDYPSVNYEFKEKYHCLKFFQREFRLDIVNGDPSILPSSLSLAEHFVPSDIETKRTNTPFFAGKCYGTRVPYVQHYENISGLSNTRDLFPYSEFSNAMMQHKIGIDLVGVGEDTIRHYEIPANGLLLLAPKRKMVIEHDFVDGESAVFYDGLDDFKEKLKYCMEHESFTDKIRLAGREHFLKYHTGTKRAQQLLDRL